MTANASILLVDDREENLTALAGILEPLGQRLVKASSGVEALRCLLREDFALILLDVQMPGMDGFETATLIRQRQRSRTIPIIFVTALSSDEQYIYAGYTVGAVDYMLKPLNAEIVRSKVSVFIALYEQARQLQEQAEELRLNAIRESERRAMERELALERQHREELAAAYEREKRIATVLQNSMLLAPPQDVFPGITVEAFYEPALDDALVGGDFFDIFAIAGGQIAVIIGDVTGKGLIAAAHIAGVKYALRAFLHEEADAARALERLNNVLCHTPLVDETAVCTSFVCIALLLLNPETGQAVFTGGGMEYPLLIRNNTAPEPVSCSGLPLGISPETEYETLVTTVQSGETILMLTDGITEARDKDDLFGYHRVCDFASASAQEALPDLGKQLLDAARGFAGGKFQDDTCLLLIRRS